MTTPADVFKTLWARVVSENVELLYIRPKIDELPSHRRRDQKPDHANRCMRKSNGTPQFQTCVITLFRDPVPTPRDQPDLITDPETDCIRLAHEYGHHLGHVVVVSPPELWYSLHVIANRLPYTVEDRLLCHEDEVRAWMLGREVLKGLGITEWKEFDDEEKLRLAGYRELHSSLIANLHAARQNPAA